MSKAWMAGAEIGKLYVLEDDDDLKRVGSCWMDGRLRIGDVILCVAHSGDSFYDYVLIDVFDNGCSAILESEFGAYALGKELNWCPSKKEFHLLLSGGSIQTENCVDHPLSFELQEMRDE